MTHLQRMTLVDVPFSAVMEQVEQYFSERPKLRLKVIASARTAVEVQYQLIGDDTDVSRRHDALKFQWAPVTRLLPNCAGILTVRPQFKGSLLIVNAKYQPPGAVVGALFDSMVGRFIATITLDAFLRDIRRDVETKYQKIRKSFPTVEELNAHRQP